jgi:hypothetical protein
MKAKNRRVAFACVSVLLMSACAVGWWHTPDSKLEENFSRHEAEFEALVAEVNADENLQGFRVDEGWYAHRHFSDRSDFSELGRLGLTRERWVSYKQQLRKLGIAQVTKGEGAVEFRVDTGFSYKGYMWSLTPPTGHRKASLDGYRISENDKDRFGNYDVYKPIKGHWRLTLFVPRSWL